jgi:hypothetical protein
MLATQRLLSALGEFRGSPSALSTSASTSAIMSFEARNAMTIDGKPSAQLLLALANDVMLRTQLKPSHPWVEAINVGKHCVDFADRQADSNERRQHEKEPWESTTTSVRPSAAPSSPRRLARPESRFGSMATCLPGSGNALGRPAVGNYQTLINEALKTYMSACTFEGGPAVR